MIVLNFCRNIIGTLIFALGGLLVTIAIPILAPNGRKFVKEGVLAALIEHLTGCGDDRKLKPKPENFHEPR